MSTLQWSYLKGGKRQHAIRPDDISIDLMESAICGHQVLSLLPATAKWQSDPEGLAAREKCRQCVTILER